MNTTALLFGTPFSVASLPGLKRWLKADAGLLTDGASLFNGSGGLTGDNTAYQVGSGSWAVMCFFKATTFNLLQAIVYKGTIRSNANTSYYLIYDVDNRVYLGVGNGSAYVEIVTPATVAPYTWHHIVGRFNSGTNALDLWLDGIKVATTTYSAGFLNTSASNLNVGGPTNGLNGDIAQFGFLKVAPLDSDITTIYDAGSLALPYGQAPGLLVNSPTWSTSVPATSPYSTYGHSLQFTAANPAQRVTLSGPITPSSAFSLAAWVNVSAISAGESCVFGFQSNHGLFIASAGGSNCKLDYYTGATHYSSLTFAKSAWHHIAITYDGTTLKLYVDGVLDGTTYTISTTVQWVRLGNDNSTTGDEFQGNLLDVRMWNSAISGTDIANIFSGSGSVATATAWLKANDGSGTIAADSISSGAFQTLGNPWTSFGSTLQAKFTAFCPCDEPLGAYRHDLTGNGWELYDALVTVTLDYGPFTYTPTLANQNITSIADQSPNGNGATTSAAATRSKLALAAQNGRNGVKFAYRDQFNALGNAMVLGNTPSGASTICLAGQITHTPEPTTFYSVLTRKNATGPLFWELDISNVSGDEPLKFRGDFLTSGSASGVAQSLGDLIGHAVAVSWDGASTYTANIDNQSQSVVSSGTLARTSTDQASLGGRLDSSSNITDPSSLLFYELIECSSLLNSGQITQTLAYLNGRWNLFATGTPAAPTWVSTATWGTYQGVQLSWTSVPFSTYSIRRSPTGAGTWTTIASGLTLTTYADLGNTGPTTYDYQVWAVNAIGAGPFSSTQTLAPLDQTWSTVFSALQYVCNLTTGLYKDTARTTPATTNGDAVQAGTDSSSHARHPTTSAAHQGTYTTNVIGSVPAVSFDGTKTYFSIPSVPAFTGDSYAMWVGNIDSTVRASGNRAMIGDSGANPLLLTLNSTLKSRGNGGGTNETLVTTTRVIYIESIVQTVSSTTTWSVYINGTLYFSETVTANNCTPQYLGSFNALTEFFDGYMLFAAAANAAPSATQRAQFADYVHRAFGCPGLGSFTIVDSGAQGALGWTAAPSLLQLANGDFITTIWDQVQETVFTAPTSNFRFARSTDGAQTWGAPYTAFSSPDYGCISSNGPVQLADGTVLWPAMQYLSVQAITEDYLFRSSDNAVTWTDPLPVAIRSQFAGLGYTFIQQYGRMWEVSAGGDIYFVCYGNRSGHVGTTDAILLVSHDRGYTWSLKSVIADGVANSKEFSESAICPVPGAANHWISLSREDSGGTFNGNNLWMNTSTDNGATWGTPAIVFAGETTALSGLVAPDLIPLASGKIIAQYTNRGASNVYGVRAHLTPDGGTTWWGGYQVHAQPTRQNTSENYSAVYQRASDGRIVSIFQDELAHVRCLGFNESDMPQS